MTTATNIPQPEDEQSSRILIIDDNPQIHRDFELVLLEEPVNAKLEADEQLIYGREIHATIKSGDYLLDHAYSGLEGIEKVTESLARERPYQLAFVDIRMPGLDGVETIARIWKIDPKIQTVICTAYADYSQEDLIRKLGRTDSLLVLKKPFDSIEITQLARTLTEKWYLARQAAMKLEQMELLVSRRTQKLLELKRLESSSIPLAGTSAAPGNVSLAPVEKKRLLVVTIGNNADVNSRIQSALSNDYEITAADGPEGFEKSLEIIPDIITINIFTPQTDAFDLCRRLKSAQLTSHVPVILIATRDAEDCQLKALEAGADDYILKSFDIPGLKARMKHALAHRQKFDAAFDKEIALQPRELAVNQADAQFLRRVIAAVEQKMSDFEFDVDVLAHSVTVSRRQLFRKLKAVLNITPNKFIRSLRLKRAAQLLVESQMTVTEITFAVGFLDVKHFRVLFKKEYGVLPSAYTAGTAHEGSPPASSLLPPLQNVSRLNHPAV